MPIKPAAHQITKVGFLNTSMPKLSFSLDTNVVSVFVGRTGLNVHAMINLDQFFIKVYDAIYNLYDFKHKLINERFKEKQKRVQTQPLSQILKSLEVII